MIAVEKPLAWKKATVEEQQMLQELQGNILKGHGRPETVNIFFQFDPTRQLESRRVLREIATFHITSAYQQLHETERFQASAQSGATFVSLMLAASGYEAIDRAALAPIGEPQFTKGMKHQDSLDAVNDLDTNGWEPHFQEQIDGMILVGDMNRNRVRLKRDELVGLLVQCNARIVGEQVGSAIKNKANDGIEHFGYVDGRSQPLLLQEDINKESATAGISQWNPTFGLETALVKDAPLPNTTSFGSYFIFRKLEQDVLGFKRKEQELATKVGLKTDETREIAGALAVGRFEDGTPVTLSDKARGLNPPNNFDYTGDAGSRCPFQGHIRKVNPRGSGPGGAADERSRIMVRRGIPFEDQIRQVHPSDLPGSESLTEFDAKVRPHLPSGGVGLLFMAYNSSLTKQFVFTQQSWANNGGFSTSTTGLDPVIGHTGTAITAQTWPKQWDDPSAGSVSFDFRGFVHMRGGEYFFAPSLTTLKSL